MSKFNSHLEEIFDDLQVEDYFKENNKDCERIRDYVVGKLCEAPDFKRIFEISDLFGSTTTHLPVNAPKEKDVMLLLKMPGKNRVEPSSPGFVTLNYTELRKLRVNKELMEGLVNPRNEYLDKDLLERWLEKLFKGIFTSRPEVKGFEADKWSLQYRKCNEAFRVTATASNAMEISVDFFFGIKLYRDTWPYGETNGIFKTASDYWYAFPTASFNSNADKEASEFLVANPRAEKLKLLDSNFKPVCRLLKAFCNRNRLYQIRNYYLTSLFLIEIDSQKRDFRMLPIDIMFVHILGKLLEAFQNGHLPYFWSKDLNLLRSFDRNDLLRYKDTLKRSYEILKGYPGNPSLTLKECRSHFRMSEFNSHLETILAELQENVADRKEKAKDYKRARNYIIRSLCEASTFKMILETTDLFGNTFPLNWTIEPTEEDVILVLKLPGENGIKVDLIKDCPGFVTLDYSEGLKKLSSSKATSLGLMRGLVNRQTRFLDKLSLQKCLEGLFEKICSRTPKLEGARSSGWSLQYVKSDEAFRVTATADNGKQISIDFIPGIKLYGNWPYRLRKGIFETPSDYWYACSMSTSNRDANISAFGFEVVNPLAESILLNKDGNLKSVYCLLKALRNRYRLHKIRDYFLATLFLFEIEAQNGDFWKQSIDIIFVHMVEKLLESFRKSRLPYYWDNEMNLLRNFEHNALLYYKDVLERFCAKLRSYPSDDSVTIEQCRAHFWMSEFRSHLEAIHGELQIKDGEYAEDYRFIRDYIINQLREVNEFEMIYGGADLLGSTSTHVPIIDPKETDIMLVLNLPDYKGLKVKVKRDGLGSITLDYSKRLQDFRSREDSSFEFMQQIVDRKTGLVDVVRLQKWLSRCFEGIFKNHLKVKGVQGQIWSLQFLKRDEAFRVTAKGGRRKEISIDFVFGIKLLVDTWPFCKNKGIFETKSDYWYACPITSLNSDGKKVFEFQLANPRAEKLKMLGKRNAGPAYRLLKAFRNQKGLYEIKNYFLTTLFLNEITHQDSHFWKQSIDIIFIHMLRRLLESFGNGYLPYYWDHDMNLLRNFACNDLLRYKAILEKFYKFFQDNHSDSPVTLRQCRSHFWEDA